MKDVAINETVELKIFLVDRQAVSYKHGAMGCDNRRCARRRGLGDPYVC